MSEIAIEMAASEQVVLPVLTRLNHGNIDDADVGAVAEAIAKIVDAPYGNRPFRVHIDPTQDGAEVAFGVIDRVRTEMLHGVRLDELLTPAKT